MILVELFTAAACPPCDEARALLERVRETLPFSLREVRLHEGDALYEEYREMLPVVHINRVPAFRYRLHEGTLRIRLQQIADGKNKPATEDDTDTGEVIR